MRDYMSLGPTPAGEPCAQVGADNFPEQSRKECRAFINQLRRMFGEEPPLAELRVKSFPHDFGTYREVVCYYDEDDKESTDYAYNLEANTPEYWDDQAKKELA